MCRNERASRRGRKQIIRDRGDGLGFSPCLFQRTYFFFERPALVLLVQCHFQCEALIKRKIWKRATIYRRAVGLAIRRRKERTAARHLTTKFRAPLPEVAGARLGDPGKLRNECRGAPGSANAFRCNTRRTGTCPGSVDARQQYPQCTMCRVACQ